MNQCYYYAVDILNKKYTITRTDDMTRYWNMIRNVASENRDALAPDNKLDIEAARKFMDDEWRPCGVGVVDYYENPPDLDLNAWPDALWVEFREDVLKQLIGESQ